MTADEAYAKDKIAEYSARAIEGIDKIIKAGAVDDEEVVVRDTLANLMWWCEKKGVDFAHELDIAQGNFEAEVIGED